MKTSAAVVLACFTLAGSPFCSGQTLSDLDEAQRHLEEAATLRQDAKRYDQLAESVEQAAKERVMMCLRAFGSQQFCSCLTKQLPWGIEFRQYIAIVTTTREKIGYSRLRPDDRDTYDRTVAVRDRCVADSRHE